LVGNARPVLPVAARRDEGTYMAFQSLFFSRFVTAFAIVLLTTSGVRADDSGSISGTVLLRMSHLPLSGVSVKISDELGSSTISSTTNKSGHYSVVGLQPGRYTGLFEKSGLEYVVAGFDICPGAQTTMTTLMRPPLRVMSGSVEQIRRSFEQPKPSTLSTSTTTVVFDQWSGVSPPHCM
jgi:hypothetical protein